MDSNEIERVHYTKFLGIIIDEHLTWKEHIMRVNNKLSKSLAIMYKTKHLLNKSALYTLYCSLFLPYVIYCLEIWGSTYITNVNSIFVLQKKAIRLISGVGYREHTNDLFYNLNIIKFLDLVKLKICLVMYKVKKMILPNNLLQLLHLEENNVYNTRNSNKFRCKYARTNIKKMCISVTGIKLFNTLSDDLINSKNSRIFVKNMVDSYKT